MVNQENAAVNSQETAGNVPPVEEKPAPYGFGGWLYFVAIGLVYTFGSALYYTADTLIPLFRDGTMLDMLDENPRLLHVIIYEALINLVYIIFPVFAVYLGLKQKKLFRNMMINFYILNFCFNVIYYFFTNSMEEFSTPEFMTEQGRSTVKSLITCFIWIPYFINSKRVKNTYIY